MVKKEVKTSFVHCRTTPALKERFSANVKAASWIPLSEFEGKNKNEIMEGLISDFCDYIERVYPIALRPEDEGGQAEHKKMPWPVPGAEGE